jgi:CBS domain-containing protein
LTREGYSEFGSQRRKIKPNTGKFVHDMRESLVKGPLDFKQRISRHESGLMAVAKKDVVTIPPTTTIMGAAKTMVGYGYRRLPVADAGTRRIEGICTVGDIINFFGGGDKHRIIYKKYDGNMIIAINAPITEIMQENVITINDGSSLEDAVNIMIEKSVGGAPVVDGEGRVVGMITERDIVHLAGESITEKRVDGIMSRSVMTAPPEMTIGDAAKTMISSGFRRLPIVSNDLVCGLITATDIMRYLGKGDAFKKLVTGMASEALSPPVSYIMKTSIITAGPEEDIGAIARKMFRNRIGCMPVIGVDGLEGIITERDIMLSLGESEK